MFPLRNPGRRSGPGLPLPFQTPLLFPGLRSWFPSIRRIAWNVPPLPGGSLTHAEASYNSVYGLVKSGWTREDGKTVYTVAVPANCTAELRLPGGRRETLGPGSYTFES